MPTPGGVRRSSGESGIVNRTPASRGALESLHLGINPLVREAFALILLAPELRKSYSQADAESLFDRTADAVRDFERKAVAANEPDQVVKLARYVLCVTIDEAALSRPWSENSKWRGTKLSVQFHQDNQGGTNLFQVLDRIIVQPDKYLHLLELIYLCLSFGFQGKYRTREDGYLRLEQRRDELLNIIIAQRGEPNDVLSLQWEPVEDLRPKIAERAPLWIVGAAAAAVLVVLFSGLLIALNKASDPVFRELAAFGQVIRDTAPLQPPSVVPERLRLASLLGSDIDAGLVQVDEDAFSSIVVMRGDGLFASGSAAVEPEREPLIVRIAAALDRFDGDVTVTGHTDNVPIRTLRFPSNYELSLQRAETVARMLSTTMASAGRLSFEGLADADPVASNDSAAGRALNRRVEIELFHTGGVR